jgi:branched-chain amino acid transport system permease protein
VSRLLAPGAGLLVLAVAAALPWLGGPFLLSLASLWLIHCAVALSWDIVGSRGDLSFGHGAFFGLGAYALAAAVKSGWPLPAGLAAAVLAPALLAAAASLVLGRLRGVGWALATLALPALLQIVARSSPLTGGAGGLVLPVTVGAEVVHWGALMAAAWAAWMHTRLGAAGVPRSRREALIVSALPTGLAGALFVLGTGAVAPEVVLGGATTLAPVTMAIVGGRGTLAGPLVGAAALTVIAETLWPPGSLALLAVEGALTLVFALAFPGGLVRLAGWCRGTAVQ